MNSVAFNCSRAIAERQRWARGDGKFLKYLCSVAIKKRLRSTYPEFDVLVCNRSVVQRYGYYRLQSADHEARVRNSTGMSDLLLLFFVFALIRLFLTEQELDFTDGEQ